MIAEIVVVELTHGRILLEYHYVATNAQNHREDIGQYHELENQGYDQLADQNIGCFTLISLHHEYNGPYCHHGAINPGADKGEAVWRRKGH